MEPSVATKAGEGVDFLASVWPKHKERLIAAFPKDVEWIEEVKTVEGKIAEAGGHCRDGKYGEAHEALESVRVVLLQGRRRNGLDYFVDRLTEFHEPMEAIVLLGKDMTTLSFQNRSQLKEHLEHAWGYWAGIEASQVDPVLYGLNKSQVASLKNGLEREKQALENLRKLVDVGTDKEVLQAAVAIKPPFARLFTTFGRSPK